VQTIHPDESKIVKEIFTMFLDKNISMTQIAKTLNARKVPTKNNTTWKPATIKQILINPTYIGKVRYSLHDENKYFESDGHHEPIITNKMFQLVQDKIKNMPIGSRTKKPKDENYFCGALVCATCGSKFTTKNVSKTGKNGEKLYNRNYTCSKKIYHNDEIACKSPLISHNKMEDAFFEYIKNINDPTEVEGINIENNAKKIEQELIESIVDCEKKLDGLQDRNRKVMELFVKGSLQFDEYRKMLDMMNEEFDILDSELQRKKTELPLITTVPDVMPQDVILNIQENWKELSNNERMMFLQRFVKKINIKVEKVPLSRNVVTIQGIEFHSGQKPEIKETMSARIKRLKTVRSR